MRLSFVALVIFSVGTTYAAPPREVEVKAADGVTSLTIKLSPNKARVPAVTAQEASPELSAALWQAAFAATQATGTSVLDFEFSLKVKGSGAGAGAGLLTASTLTALIRNKKLLPNTTLAGTINPDGTSGPVGGLLGALRGAAAEGVRRFGFPLGSRQQLDDRGETIDLLAEGQLLGVEVRELRSLDEAYTFLTGAPLPRPAAISEDAMDLAPEELAAIARLADRLKADASAERPELEKGLKRLGAQAAAPYRKSLEGVEALIEKLERNGEAVTAMFYRGGLLTNLRSTAQDVKLRLALDEGDVASAVAVLEAHAAALPIEQQTFRKEIEAQFPQTSRNHDIFALDLLESVVGLEASAQRARASVPQLVAAAQKPMTDDEKKALGRKLRRTADDLLRVREELRNGQRFLVLYGALPPKKNPRPSVEANPLASSYVAAGTAARASFEGLSTKDTAWSDLVDYGESLSRETDPRGRLLLGLRQTILTARLVNTWSALGGRFDDKGALSLTNTRVLTAQLEIASTRVREACGRAQREAGGVPLPARFRYLNARASREGSDEQKVDALSQLWLANWWCEFAVRAAK
jgi:hypothetical protein